MSAALVSVIILGILLLGSICGNIYFIVNMGRYRKQLDEARERERKLTETIRTASDVCRELGKSVASVRELATGQAENIIILRRQIEQARQVYSELENKYNNLVNSLADYNDTTNNSTML